MSNSVSNGWHKVGNKRVFVDEFGQALRAVYDDRTLYPYRSDGKGGFNLSLMTLPALRAGLARGTVKLL